MIGKQGKESFSLVICPNGYSKRALYGSDTKFSSVKKIPYLRKKS